MFFGDTDMCQIHNNNNNNTNNNNNNNNNIRKRPESIELRVPEINSGTANVISLDLWGGGGK